ncbi:MAG: hypothetical protein Q9170_003034 [Blastenia crenularia]
MNLQGQISSITKAAAFLPATVELSEEDLDRKAIEARDKMEEGIRAQMRWKPSCRSGSAKFSYSAVVASPAVFYKLFELDADRMNKLVQFGLIIFQNTTRIDAFATIGYGHLDITDEMVTLRWDPQLLATYWELPKLSGTAPADSKAGLFRMGRCHDHHPVLAMAGSQKVPPTYTPEYLNQYNGDSLHAIAILFIVLVVIFVTLRFYARRMGRVAWGFDDSLIIPGIIFCLGLCIAALVDLSDGALGYHQAAVIATHPTKLVRRSKFILAAPLLYLIAVLFPKLSILATYLRIFISPSYRISCYALAAFLVANWFTFTVACFKMCTPLPYLWDRKIAGGHCFDINQFYRWSAFPNIVTDVAMLVLPLPVVWKLHTSQNIKIGLTIMFTTGSIGLLTSIMRFAGYFFNNPTSDSTYSGSYLYIYVICESSMYTIAACLLTYKPLATLFRKDGPLSMIWSRSRALTWKSSQTSSGGASHRTSSLPLRDFRANRFEPLDDAGTARMGTYKGENVV